MTDVFDRIEGMFDRWLKGFEEHPFKSGVKVFLVILFIRFLKKELLS